jgi:hypothetical protein
MGKVIKDIYTESDNETWDLSKMLATASIVSAILLNAYTVYKGSDFNMQDFGIGMGALFGGVGVALGMKKESNVSKS